jgi:hypothetical protein
MLHRSTRRVTARTGIYEGTPDTVAPLLHVFLVLLCSNSASNQGQTQSHAYL